MSTSRVRVGSPGRVTSFAAMARLRLAWKWIMMLGVAMFDRDANAERGISRRYEGRRWCDSVEQRLIYDITGRRTSW
jgi:hypothetical protein